MWLILQRGKTYPHIETVQDRIDLLTQRHKVPGSAERRGSLGSGKGLLEKVASE